MPAVNAAGPGIAARISSPHSENVKRTLLLFVQAFCVAAATAQEQKPDPAKDLAAPLRKFDANKDGRLSADELKQARQAHNRGGREPQPDAGTWRETLQRQERQFIERWKKDFDSNGDGKLDDAERGELRDVWKVLAEKYTSIRDLVTAKYDRNDDGELNDAERNASRGESERLRQEAENQCISEWRERKKKEKEKAAAPEKTPP